MGDSEAPPLPPAPAEGAPPAAAPPAAGGETKRKSRWGEKAEDAGGEGKKRSRWGEKATPAPANNMAMVPLGMQPGSLLAPPILAAPAMTPEQMKVQGRLNEIPRLRSLPK